MAQLSPKSKFQTGKGALPKHGWPYRDEGGDQRSGKLSWLEVVGQSSGKRGATHKKTSRNLYGGPLRSLLSVSPHMYSMEL